MNPWGLKIFFSPILWCPPGYIALPPPNAARGASGSSRGDVHDENAYALDGVAGHAGCSGRPADVWTLLRRMLTFMSGEGGYGSLPRPIVHTIWTRWIRSECPLGFDPPGQEGSSSGHHFSPRTRGAFGVYRDFLLAGSRPRTHRGAPHQPGAPLPFERAHQGISSPIHAAVMECYCISFNEISEPLLVSIMGRVAAGRRSPVDGPPRRSGQHDPTAGVVPRRHPIDL